MLAIFQKITKSLNDPKSHGQAVPLFQSSKFSLHIYKICNLLDRSYMEKNHMKRLKLDIEKILEAVTNYIGYLEILKSRNNTVQEKESGIKSFIVSDIKTIDETDAWLQRFRRAFSALDENDNYTPINITNLFDYSSPQQIYNYVTHKN